MNSVRKLLFLYKACIAAIGVLSLWEKVDYVPVVLIILFYLLALAIDFASYHIRSNYTEITAKSKSKMLSLYGSVLVVWLICLIIRWPPIFVAFPIPLFIAGAIELKWSTKHLSHGY